MERKLDWEQSGYKLEKELGLNATGDRVSYLAREIATDSLVVIKQFQFATASSNWNAMLPEDYFLANYEGAILTGAKIYPNSD